MSSSLEAEFAATCENDGQVIVVVTVTVSDAATINNHRLIEQGAVTDFHRIHRLEEIRQLIGVKSVDLSDALQFFFITTVVGETVVPVTNADVTETSV